MGGLILPTGFIETQLFRSRNYEMSVTPGNPGIIQLTKTLDSNAGRVLECGFPVVRGLNLRQWNILAIEVLLTDAGVNSWVENVCKYLKECQLHYPLSPLGLKLQGSTSYRKRHPWSTFETLPEK